MTFGPFMTAASAHTSASIAAFSHSSASFAGFWRRVAAFIVDAFVLGFIGYALGLVFFDAFVRLGPAGRCVGFVVALAYFVLQESGRGGGQSLGKRLLRIRVVDAHGRALSPALGAVRFAVFGVPYFLTGAALPLGLATFAGGFVVAVLGLGGVLALAYLLVFNRRTRQSLHDLAVGACVVRVPVHDPARLAPPAVELWRGHRVITAVLVLLAGGIPLLFPQWMHAPLSADLQALDRRLAAEPGLRSVNVFALANHRYGEDVDGVRHELLVQATLVSPVVDDVALSTRLAGMALAGFPEANRLDEISVRLAHGFDIGIASNWTANELALTPAQWADRLAAGVGN